MTDPRARLFIRRLNHNLSEGRKRREDYLTEVFSFVLEIDPDARRALLGAGCLLLGGTQAIAGPDLDSIEIRTQASLAPAERPDIEISVGKGFRRLVESKVDESFNADQIARYVKHARPSHRDHVVSLVPSRSLPRETALPAHGPFVGIVTWGVAVDLIASDALLSRVQPSSLVGGDNASQREVASRYMRVVDAKLGAFFSRDDVDASRILLQEPEPT